MSESKKRKEMRRGRNVVTDMKSGDRANRRTAVASFPAERRGRRGRRSEDVESERERKEGRGRRYKMYRMANTIRPYKICVPTTHLVAFKSR